MSSNAKEAARLASLDALGIMDTPPEAALNEAVQLAATICDTPIALISVIDDRRQWFKAKFGLTISETPREHAFCAYAIRENRVFVVPDPRLDPRFRDNPMVTDAPNIRFYAGAPFYSPEGHPLGTICVIDTIPRALSAKQTTALLILSHQVTSQIARSSQINKLREGLAETERVQQEIISSNALFQAFMDNSPMVGFMKDAHGRLLYYNQPFASRFQIGRNEWIGKDDFELWPQEMATNIRAVDLAVLEEGELRITEDPSPGPDGTILHWRTYRFPFLGSSGQPLLAGLSLDISREKEVELALQESHRQLTAANERLRELATTDALTGVGNRRAFDERFAEEYARACRHGTPLSLLLFDIDDFKAINDTLGHEVGDQVLRRVAGCLRDGSRASDLVYRYEGEMFAMLLPNTMLDQALVAAERLRSEVETADWQHRAVTISGGASSTMMAGPAAPRALERTVTLELHPSGLISGPETPSAEPAIETSVWSLARQADLALYRAKALGKNQVVAYEAGFESGLPVPTA
jgi:diguanylate cyclase (GGDEF)-like protein